MSMMKLTGLGTWAFAVIPQGAPSSPFAIKVMNVASPHPRGAVWTINLNSFQAKGDVQATAGQPVRNKTAFFDRLIARITFTGGGEVAGGSAQETVDIDYPAAGTVVTVVATAVNVEIVGQIPSLVGGTAGNTPQISGWISTGRSSGRPMTATLTEPLRVVIDGQGFQENVPPRARAFRLQFVSFPRVVSLLQLSGNATPVAVCQDTPSYIPESGHGLEASRAMWWPLSPEAQALVVSNQDGLGGTGQWRVQWLLELG